jgi:hypothetical protein
VLKIFSLGAFPLLPGEDARRWAREPAGRADRSDMPTPFPGGAFIRTPPLNFR